VRLELDQPDFGVGEFVCGRAVLEIRRAVHPTNLNLKFKVKEETAWNDKQERDGRMYYYSYKARLVYFNHLYPLVLWDEGDEDASRIKGKETVKLVPPQTLVYPFRFKLDKNHPVSHQFQ
jgi:hypothetical protein